MMKTHQQSISNLALLEAGVSKQEFVHYMNANFKMGKQEAETLYELIVRYNNRYANN